MPHRPILPTAPPPTLRPPPLLPLAGGAGMPDLTPDLTPVLRLAGVTLSYPQRSGQKKAGGKKTTQPAVQNFSLDLMAGEVVALLGPSGCGKSSLLRLIAGLEHPQHGQVYLQGRCVASGSAPEGVAGVVPGGGRYHGRYQATPPERRRVGLLFQDFALFPHLTVAANIGFGLADWSPAARAARIAMLLDYGAIAHLAQAWPRQISGGEQQRVALARALAPAPNLLLLDEPFSNLDRSLRRQLRQDTKEMFQKLGQTVLLVTHDAEEAMMMADRLVVMQQGQLVQQGTPSEIYAAPASIFVAEQLGEINRLVTARQNGLIATPFGEFAAASAEDGDAALIVAVRAEHLRLALSPPAHLPALKPQARMLSQYQAGGALWVELACLPHTGFSLTLRAEIGVGSAAYADLTDAAAGQLLWLEVAPAHILWFPA